MRQSVLSFLRKCSELIIFSVVCSPVYASEMGSLPWDNVLQTVINWLTGDIARAIIIISIISSGITFIFGEHGGAFRKGAAIVFGGSIAIGAVNLYHLLGFSGAVL